MPDMRHLPPMRLRERYYLPIEKEIDRLLYELLYRPLAKIIMKKDPGELRNSINKLLEAIMSGRVWYEDGQFKGQFSAGIVKELRSIGATFNRKSGSYSLTGDLLPTDIKFAAAQASYQLDQMRRGIIGVLDGVDPEIILRLSNAERQYAHTVDQMQRDFADTVAAISISPVLTAEAKKMISKQWGTNLDLYIKGWLEQDILKFREKVQQHVMAGGRAAGLVDMLQQNYGVSKRKAKFLARQETSLLMSKFHETRLHEIGIDEYKWSTSHDERVRHDHAVLDGKIFRFSDPPITNRKTGARNNPGEDFNCRCVAVPVVR